MQLSALVGFVAVGLSFLVADRLFEYYGMGAFGGGLIALIGLRVVEDGVTRQTDIVRTVDFGEIPVGFLLMIAGSLVFIQSMHKLRREF